MARSTKRDGRRADVAADQRRASAGGDDLARQGGGRGLAVGAGDGDDLALQEARRQFDFADDGNAALARLHQLRHVEGHAGADDDQVLIAEGALAMLAGFDPDAVVEQRGNFLAKLLWRLGIGDGDPRAPVRQKQSAGHAGFAQPDHQHAFAFNIHECRSHPQLVIVPRFARAAYRNFNVVRAKSANTSEAIQKRTMTFDSLQPSSSK